MDWADAFNMENVIVTSCSYGGPLAVRRDPKKIVKIQGSGKPCISIFSASGQMISTIVVSLMHSNFSNLLYWNNFVCV